MKGSVLLLFSLVIVNNKILHAQAKPILKFSATPFQGTRQYCDLKPLKYKVTIKGYNVTIVEYYKNEKPTIVTGTYKKGRLYTNNPNEKKYKMSGTYYAIYPESFGYSNLEGGDFILFELCR